MDGITTKRLAYRIGDRMPKPIRIIYYIILGITLIYWLYRFIAGVLSFIQKLGSFVFEKHNYYTFVVCILILAIGILLASQFIFGLNPFGKVCDWFVDKWNDIRQWGVELIGG